MNPMTIGILVFAVTFGGALAGIWLHTRLPESHLSADSQATVKVGIGLIATMTALVLGLITASAKNSFDTLDAAVKQSAAEVLTLDRMLARYGPESAPARVELRKTITTTRNKAWPDSALEANVAQIAAAPASAERVVAHIRALPEQDDDQRWLKGRAMDVSEQLLETRWLIFSTIGSSVPVPFLVVLMFWLTLIFVSFGLFAPKNGTVISILFVCAVSVASAIFMILEMDGPFGGVIRISPEPLDFALSQLDK